MPRRAETLSPVRPNAGFEAIYRGKLYAFITAMQTDIARQVKACYDENEPEIAQDESPAMALRNLMKKLTVKWLKRADDTSQELAKWFAQGSARRSDAALKAILKKGGYSVEFKLTAPVNDVLQAAIGENVSLIKSIASEHLSDVEGMVMRSVSSGRDLHQLTEDLAERYDITKKRAAFIARDQNNKATGQIGRARQDSLGITEGIWKHSRGGHHPRAPHVKYSGTKFNLKEGHDFNDGFGPVIPGQAINCKCVWTPVIPALAKKDAA